LGAGCTAIRAQPPASPYSGEARPFITVKPAAEGFMCVKVTVVCS